MDKICSLPATMSETLVQSDLSSIVMDGVEIGIDQCLSDGILKDIPIINSIASIVKATQSISNYLYLKKIVSFLNGIKDVPKEKREQEIRKIEESKKYRNKVGEQLLFILDHCEDDIKAEYISYWFRAFLNSEIDYSDFIQGASAINKITTEDFKAYIRGSIDLYYDSSVYIGAGLLFISMDRVSVKNEVIGDWDDDPKLVTHGGELEVNDTYLGDKIKTIFKDIVK